MVADIHFDYRLAIQCINSGISALRLHPGNIGKLEHTQSVVKLAKQQNIPIRIGVNAGSLEKDLQQKDCPLSDKMVESAMGHIKILEDMDFDLIKVFKFLPKKDVRVLAKNALKAIKESGIVVELNSAGLRKPVGEIYPSDILLEEIANLDVNITLSSDAHSVEQVTQNYEKLLEKAKFFGYSKVAYFRQKDIEFINLD